MIIITQKLRNLAINILKNTFFEVNKVRMPDLIENIFFNVGEDAYSKGMISLNDGFKKMIIETMKLAIPRIDNAFLSSDYRKHNFYKCDTHKRSITTIYGDLDFERIYYTDKDKKNGFYFIDELFKFEKYTTYDPLVRAILIDSSTNTNANITSNETNLLLNDYSNYLNNNKFKNVSRQTIHTWIHKWKIPKIKYEPIEGVKRLYVMVDEKWIHEYIRHVMLNDDEKDKHHYIMGKCFVTFTGAITKNNRKQLLNRHIFMTSNDTPWKSFIDEIFNIYNFEEIDEIYLLSDCGNWILSGKDELKLNKNNKVIANTCEFHVKLYINRFTSNKENRDNLYKLIYVDKDKKGFIKLADEIIEKVNDEKKKEKKTKYKDYIVKHWKSILNMTDRDVKSSMESHISHYMANYFGSRPKGFSRNRIENYIKLQEDKFNGVNIMSLYLSSYNKKEEDNFVYDEQEVSFSIFEKSSSNIPVKSSSNPISLLLNNIAFCS